MNYTVLIRSIFVLMLSASVASAQNPVKYGAQNIPVPQLTLKYEAPPLVAIPAGDDVIVSLQKGEPAPYMGQLMDVSTALRWAHYLQQARLRLTEDVISERKICNANMTFMQRRMDLESSFYSSVEKDLRSRVLHGEQQLQNLQYDVNNPSIFQSNGFWFGIGVATALSLVGAGILVSKSL